MDQSTLSHILQSSSNFSLTDEIVFVSADNSVFHEAETREDLHGILQGLSGANNREQTVQTAPAEHEVCPFTELCTIKVLTVSLKDNVSEVNEVTIPEALASSLHFCCKVCGSTFQSYFDFDKHVKTHNVNSTFEGNSPGHNGLPEYNGLPERKIVDGSGDNKQDKNEDLTRATVLENNTSETKGANSLQIASIAQELIGLATSAPKISVPTKQPNSFEEIEDDPLLMLRNDRFNFDNVFCFEGMSCSLCKTYFRHDALWEEHVRFVHHIMAPYQCIVCGREYNDMARLRGHVIKVHGKFSQMVCEKKWNKHKKNVTGDIAAPCQVCHGNGMSDREALKHVEQIEPPPETIHYQRKYVPRTDLTCHICGKVLSNRYFAKHLKLHAGDKPFECSFCGQKFTEKIALNRHVRSHTKEKPFKCKRCGAAFSLESTLSRHMLVHTGVKNHVCPVCQKSFARKSGLKKHELTHSICKQFDCTLCHRSFTLRRYLWRHYKTVHGYSLSLGK